MSLTLSHDSSCHLVESLAVSALAEFIRELIVEGTRPGLDATRARGRTGGRKPKLNGRQVATVRRMYEAVGPGGNGRPDRLSHRPPPHLCGATEPHLADHCERE